MCIPENSCPIVIVNHVLPWFLDGIVTVVLNQSTTIILYLS